MENIIVLLVMLIICVTAIIAMTLKIQELNIRSNNLNLELKRSRDDLYFMQENKPGVIRVYPDDFSEKYIIDFNKTNVEIEDREGCKLMLMKLFDKEIVKKIDGGRISRI